MTTRGLEDLDGGLGSCLPSDEFPFLEEPCSGRRPDGKARGASRPADASGWTHVLQAPETAGAAGKELAAQEAPGTSKGMPKAGTSPRSVPARRKLQAAPPLKPPPPPPPPSDELPWGDLTLNKCLVLASLVALLGSALRLCQDALAGEVPAAAPHQWVPPGPPPRKPEAPAPQPQLSVPPSGPPAPEPAPPGPPGPQAQKQDKPEATAARGEPGGAPPEASGEERAPLGDRGSPERPRKEKPRAGEKLKKEKPGREKPRREERRRASREPGPFLSRRWEARAGGRRPRDSRQLERERRQAWAPRPRRDRDSRPRQKPRGGKGRD
ncbi:junctional sarcoplasmic reticulum protein 1 [Onychomys torridus]|uniref:junctional sarcoplasmic reticulum protein 1 n=1 Tax=Onychomys torridus TaxID=38674 RepID=UPI00167F2825|nr:junctional sarcoplasmic reticulum protein 1 [Onychomys torridus]